MTQHWDPALYQGGHSFVFERGRDLVPLLAPAPGERILDVGCGTGQLTWEIARAGARVVGIDSSAAMIEEARRNFPALEFVLSDVRSMPFENEFEAVFSNAALHWVRDAERAAAAIARALRPGGRFVAEFGGQGNVAALLDAAYAALADLGREGQNPWYFPSVGEYATLLESKGLAVTYAALFDRPTPLEGGDQAIARWFTMFGGPFLSGLDDGEKAAFLRQAQEHAARHLCRDGTWYADYRRLRIAACKITAFSAQQSALSL